MAGLPSVYVERSCPTLAKLTQRMQNFVRAYVARGKKNPGKAYVDAGYKASTVATATVNACVLLHRDDIQEAIRELCLKELVALGPLALRVASELLDNPQVEASTRQRIAFNVMDRVGMHAHSEHTVKVEHVGNDPAAIGQVRTMIEQLGLDEEQAAKLFGRQVTSAAMAGPVTDVEFEEIAEEQPLGVEDEEVGAFINDEEAQLWTIE